LLTILAVVAGGEGTGSSLVVHKAGSKDDSAGKEASSTCVSGVDALAWSSKPSCNI
jgi:hypothetical protein